jgi:hypothetical protein
MQILNRGVSADGASRLANSFSNGRCVLQRWLGFTRAAWLCFLVLPLTGCGGGTAPVFTVTPAASSLTIYPGSTQTLSVAVGGNGHTPVAVSLSGLPTGITATSSPATVAPGGSVVLTLTAAVNANAGAFPASAPNNPNSATTNATVNGAAGSTVVAAPLAVTVSLSNTGFAPAPGQIDLPILKIDTGSFQSTSVARIPGLKRETWATRPPGSFDSAPRRSAQDDVFV